MPFTLESKDEHIPAVSPGSAAQRPAPTTQVMATLAEWPGNTFRIWMPENVRPLWDNWEADAAHQDFEKTRGSGLRWSYQRRPEARVEAEVAARDQTLTMECRVTNRSASDLEDVGTTHCLQLSLAPDFACGDFSRLYVRSDGQWRSLASLEPHSDYPHYFRVGRRSAGQVGMRGDMSPLYEKVEVDHPLMVCVAKEGDRCVGTASDDYRYLFHNRANQHLWCIHSQQMPVATLSPGETVEFRQRVYFVDGGLEECVAAYDADPMRG